MRIGASAPAAVNGLFAFFSCASRVLVYAGAGRVELHLVLLGTRLALVVGREPVHSPFSQGHASLRPYVLARASLSQSRACNASTPTMGLARQ
jgi:hypothetical protein